MRHECKDFEIKKYQGMNVLRCMDVGCDFYIELSYIPKLRTALTERDARIAEYKKRCLKAIETLNQMESNLLNPPQSQRLIGKIEGVKLALSYLDEIMKAEQK